MDIKVFRQIIDFTVLDEVHSCLTLFRLVCFPLDSIYNLGKFVVSCALCFSEFGLKKWQGSETVKLNHLHISLVCLVSE